MNDEKISLRIEGDELERIDAYLAQHPEAGSRSLFIKNCIRERLDRDAQPIVEKPRAGPNTITITLPGRYMAGLERMVSEDYATSVEDAASVIIRDTMRQVQSDAIEAAVDGARRATPGSI